jgi:hypothetical protein
MTDTGVVQCNGSCSASTPANSSCPATVYGCTDSSANNYDPSANFNVGCTYDPVCASNSGTSCTSAPNACGDTM